MCRRGKGYRRQRGCTRVLGRKTNQCLFFIPDVAGAAAGIELCACDQFVWCLFLLGKLKNRLLTIGEVLGECNGLGKPGTSSSGTRVCETSAGHSAVRMLRVEDWEVEHHELDLRWVFRAYLRCSSSGISQSFTTDFPLRNELLHFHGLD